MKKTLSVIITALTLAALAVCCSPYNKILKSGDQELMYTTAMKCVEAEEWDNALALLQQLTYFYQGTVREDSVLFFSGLSYYEMDDFDESETVFNDFRRRFGRSPFIEDVEYMYAMGFYHRSPRYDRDQTVTLQAMIYISEFMERYPNSIMREQCATRLKQLQNKMYDKEFYNAKTYYTIGRYKSAVVALKNALAKYPLSPHREEILHLIAKSSYELAKNSIVSLQRERYLSVMDAYYTFVAEFPESRYRSDMDRMHAESRKFVETHDAYTGSGAPQNTDNNN